MSQEEPSDRKPDPWPHWMAWHAQLKFVMTECSKTQIRLTGLNWCFNGKCQKQLVRQFVSDFEWLCWNLLTHSEKKYFKGNNPWKKNEIINDRLSTIYCITSLIKTISRSEYNFVCSRSAFFIFCGDERPNIRSAHPSWSVAEVAKELGKMWEAVTDRSSYEKRAAAEKKRYAAVSLYRNDPKFSDKQVWANSADPHQA